MNVKKKHFILGVNSALSVDVDALEEGVDEAGAI